MISVIILTKNLKYAILDVPETGRLFINELHLICGMVQNGVKCLPYGNVLTSFETFIQNETLSVGIIPHSEFCGEGRVLDFTTIELLQLSTTIPVSASGSSVAFVPPTYESGGYPVDYIIRLKGLNFASLAEANTFVETRSQGFCNALGNDGVYQTLSVYGTNMNEYALFQETPNLTEIYDIGWGLTTVGNYFFDQCPDLEIISLPNLTSWSQMTMFNNPQASKMKLLELPKCINLGTSPQQLGIFNGKIGTKCHVKLPRVHETNNAGGVHASVQQYISNNPLGVIEYID